jgi:hypothetical protein
MRTNEFKDFVNIAVSTKKSVASQIEEKLTPRVVYI